MKKILGVALVMALLLTSAGFAAAPAAVEAGKIGWGMFGGTPTMRYNFSNSMSGQLGLNYSTCSAAGATGSLSILGSMAWDIMKIGANTATSGVMLNYSSNAGNTPNNNITTVSWILGVETNLNSSLVVGFTVRPISYMSAAFGGATTTYMDFLNAAYVSAHIFL